LQRQYVIIIIRFGRRVSRTRLNIPTVVDVSLTLFKVELDPIMKARDTIILHLE
jgi:hypothetical protein